MKEGVIQVTYDFVKYLVPQLQKYPKQHKYLLGDKLYSYVLEVQELLIEAYYTPRNRKAPLLRRVNIKLEQIRYLVRLSKDFRCISIKQYEYIQLQINAIGKQVGGWLNSL